jgi:hypothetical protein
MPPDTELRLMEASNMQCLRKPFTDAELREALKTALVGARKTRRRSSRRPL